MLRISESSVTCRLVKSSKNYHKTQINIEIRDFFPYQNVGGGGGGGASDILSPSLPKEFSTTIHSNRFVDIPTSILF